MTALKKCSRKLYLFFSLLLLRFVKNAIYMISHEYSRKKIVKTYITYACFANFKHND